MKKIIATISILLTLGVSMYGQANIGLNLGCNLSYLKGDSVSLLQFKQIKPGINAGVFWEIRTAYKTYIQIGGYYSQQGGYYKKEYFKWGKKITESKKHRIDYIKIPITWKQMWGDWYTALGVYGEIAAVSKSTWRIKEESSIEIQDTGNVLQSFTNELRLYDMGLKLEIGVQIPLSNKTDMFISAGYNLGMLAINPKTIRIENKMYNRMFTLNTGIIFNRRSTKYRKRR